jgi:hypothetical protein
MSFNLSNWKTTASGVATILTAVADIVHGISSGSPVNWNVDVTAILAGLGLLFAKDASTNSTQAQVNAATTAEAQKK